MEMETDAGVFCKPKETSERVLSTSPRFATHTLQVDDVEDDVFMGKSFLYLVTLNILFVIFLSH